MVGTRPEEGEARDDEAAWLEWVCGSFVSPSESRDAVVVGPGDDAAVWRTSGGDRLLLTVDTIVEGVHFDLRASSPEAVGRKAMNVNLSDIAAMAGRPRVALVSLATPSGFGSTRLRELMTGMRAAAARFGVPVAGGDLSRSLGVLHVTVTVIGEPGPAGPVLRSGAKPGDVLAVTGPLGGASAGHHLDFVPRVEEAMDLARRYDLHAMMDLSDGLGIDLHRLCRASGVGAEIDEAAIPISAAARSLARTSGRSALDHAIGDGEDFELLVSLPATVFPSGSAERSDERLTPIGRVTDRVRVIEMRGPNGNVRPFEPRGYEHEIDSSDE